MILSPLSLPGFIRTATIMVVVFSALGCDSGPAETLYDPDRSALPDPVIQTVSPSAAAFAGVDEVTIVGSNFSPSPAENYVYFGKERAQLVSGSATELTVVPPATPNPEVGIRVSVLGAVNFSNTWTYALEAAIEPHGGFGKVESATAMTTDAEGNMYVGLIVDGVSQGIKRITPDNVRTDYVSSTFQWTAMALGPDGFLYAVRNIRAVFRFMEGGSQEVFTALTPSSVRLNALAFDASGNLWTGGSHDEIFRVTPEKAVSRFAFDAEVTALAVSGTTLFAAANDNSGSAVWSFPIEASGSLGPGTRLHDVTAALGPGKQGTGLAFASDGTIYVATDHADPVWFAAPGGTLSPLYPGVLRQPEVGGSQIPAVPSLDLAWGPDPFLYLLQSRASGGLAGDSRPLIRINTRKERG